ncbi:Methyltransferase domain-containing protein [Desulfonatronum thiosulfatophilum]|uniref:Methyltransferase domain-containing protein n=1 Tax=Desulfonatronum thiosulfatophilum TaxID=617002 RepID=A0A1G6A0F5_9BACT|nr:class I SAM-dependent methyltransferase [Desulfonatronum thiosulfatophilum]SDB01887.1 Methyltransferase domain-containing protein [Desulfonatronum thiosulfatophilum]
MMSSICGSFAQPGRRTLWATILVVCLLTAPGINWWSASEAGASPQLSVIYVPTPERLVHRMLEMAEVREDDYVIDLGSGDGRIVVAAVRDFNARAAHGIDLDPQRVAEGRENARRAGVEDRATFEEGDLFEMDFSEATVLTMYLLQTLNLRLRPVILETMRPGTRVVSHAFNMGDWEPDQHEVVDGRNAYLWIVPAQVQGRWQLSTADGREVTLSLTQSYQNISGHAVVEGASMDLNDVNLRGDEIRFVIGSDNYVGRVEGDTMVPVQTSGAAQGWNARRN